MPRIPKPPPTFTRESIVPVYDMETSAWLWYAKMPNGTLTYVGRTAEEVDESLQSLNELAVLMRGRWGKGSWELVLPAAGL